MGAPDPFRIKYREHLADAVRQIVADGAPFTKAVMALRIPDADAASFQQLLGEELSHLEPYNCARYRLPIGTTEEWISRGSVVHD